MMRLAAAVAALLLVLCGSGGALAHASLVGSEPRDGSMVAQPPDKVRLRFNEPVTPAVVRLIDAAGNTPDDALVHSGGETIEITVPSGLPAGTPNVSYRGISAGGPPVAGTMVFSVGMGKPTAAPSISDPSLGTLIWLSRIGVFLGLFVGIGGVFFNGWSAGPAAVKPVMGALVLGLGSAVVALGCQGLD